MNSPSLLYTFFLDNAFKPASTDQIDISIQRELKGNVILEVGYVGTWARQSVQRPGFERRTPWMMKLGGQTFAKAYDNLYLALSKGQTPAPQPFLETALKGSSYCAGQLQLHCRCSSSGVRQHPGPTT